jgi:hypothetical protein
MSQNFARWDGNQVDLQPLLRILTDIDQHLQYLAIALIMRGANEARDRMNPCFREHEFEEVLDRIDEEDVILIPGPVDPDAKEDACSTSDGPSRSSSSPPPDTSPGSTSR